MTFISHEHTKEAIGDLYLEMAVVKRERDQYRDALVKANAVIEKLQADASEPPDVEKPAPDE